MADLEQRLRALAPEAFPPVPDVRAAVAARIAEEEAPGAAAGPRWRVAGVVATRRRRVLALALALVLLPSAAVAAVPSTRHAVLEWLGLEHVRVERVPTTPALPALKLPDLGTEVASVARARQRAGFPVAVPRVLGTPDEVYVTSDGIVSLAYEPRPRLPRDESTGLGLLVTQLQAAGLPDYFAKVAGPRTRVEAVRVGAARGAFLSGAPHGVLIERPRGSIRELPSRLAGDTLVFERGGLVMRLEGHFDRARALELARSL
jgi:hypothetical protein